MLMVWQKVVTLLKTGVQKHYTCLKTLDAGSGIQLFFWIPRSSRGMTTFGFFLPGLYYCQEITETQHWQRDHHIFIPRHFPKGDASQGE